MIAEESQKVKKALVDVGIEINDIYDLVNSSKPYPKAVPVLIDLLEKEISHNGIKEGIIRALAVKEAKGKANKVLLELVKNTSRDNSMLLWTIGNTMEVIIMEEDISDIVEIVSNPDHGLARQMFISALGKIESIYAEEVLISLLDDKQVLLHVIDALGKMKSKKALPIIEGYANNAKGIIKKEAIKAAKRINK